MQSKLISPSKTGRASHAKYKCQRLVQHCLKWKYFCYYKNVSDLVHWEDLEGSGGEGGGRGDQDGDHM